MTPDEGQRFTLQDFVYIASYLTWNPVYSWRHSAFIHNPQRSHSAEKLSSTKHQGNRPSTRTGSTASLVLASHITIHTGRNLRINISCRSQLEWFTYIYFLPFYFYQRMLVWSPNLKCRVFWWSYDTKCTDFAALVTNCFVSEMVSSRRIW